MAKIYRCLYIAYLKEDFADVSDKLDFPEIFESKVTMLSVCSFKKLLFSYVEGIDEQPDVNRLLDVWRSRLIDVPYENGVCKWIPMMEVFHYNLPKDDKQWQRHTEKTPIGLVGKLVPEKISSYVYYHYQFQEEQPGSCDKYGLIGLHGGVLFIYGENPVVQEKAWYKGELDTLSSHDDWGERMDSHFASWDGCEDLTKLHKAQCIGFYQREINRGGVSHE